MCKFYFVPSVFRFLSLRSPTLQTDDFYPFNETYTQLFTLLEKSGLAADYTKRITYYTLHGRPYNQLCSLF